MTPLRAELWLLWRDRAAMAWLAAALVTASLAVAGGVHEVRSQRAELQDLLEADSAARRAIQAKHADWGSLAYHTFHLTYDAPSRFAFAALGQREVLPWKHRIRMLALEGQIYETDAENPSLALVGRLDFAFVASTLMPLLVIFLLHGLTTSERTAGRLELLVATAGSALWGRRAGVRGGALLLCMLAPLAVGGALQRSSVAALGAAAAAVCLHLVFWCWLAHQVGKRARSCAVSLTALVGLWLGWAVVAPATIQTVVEQAVPVPQGDSILLPQREAVNAAWDLPKQATMKPFVERHPEWRDHAEVKAPFEWKWYFAFQEVGDQAVEAVSHAYRSGRSARDQLAGWLCFAAPPAWLERTLQALARTDVAAALSYEQSVREFHTQLRAFYYPKLFEDRPFETSSVAPRPVFQPATER